MSSALPFAVALAAAPFALFVGCGSSTSGGAGGATTSSISDSAGGYHPGEPPTTTGPGTTTVCTNTGTDCNPSTEPPPQPCGGTTGLTCGEGFFCRYLDGWCGAGIEGICEKKLPGCYDDYAPVCGCDGQVWDNQCKANAAGVDYDDRGPCAVPDGYFACGAKLCAIGEEYCMRTIVALDQPGAFVCGHKPDACGADPVTCGCVEPCSECEGTADTGVIVTCWTGN